MILNVISSGGKKECYSLLVYTNSGANVTVTNVKDTFTKTADSKGAAAFCLTPDVWEITCTKDNQTRTSSITIGSDNIIDILLSYIPDFTYTGTYEIVNDNDVSITSSTGNWKIRFLTSGDLTFNNLNGAENGIDVFCVGGGGGGGGAYHRDNYDENSFTGVGGGGGGGGYSKTASNISVVVGNPYPIIIGNGGKGGSSGAFGESGSHNGSDGEQTTAFGVVANGGGGGVRGDDYHSPGGAGGTGGNNGGAGADYGDGDAENGSSGNCKEFGDLNAKAYAGGGGGGGSYHNGSDGNGGSGGKIGGGNGGESQNGSDGERYTGGGGGGAGCIAHSDDWMTIGGSGGSGIVIIRNKR